MALQTKYKWLHWFQKSYDDFKNMDWSPEMANTVQKINDAMPEVISKALIGYIKTQYEKSEDIAMQSLRAIKSQLSNIVGD